MPSNNSNYTIPPEAMTDVLLTNHRRPLHDSVRLHVAVEFSRRTIPSGGDQVILKPADWDVLIQTEFIPALASVILDNALCGYTRNEMMAWAEDVRSNGVMQVRPPDALASACSSIATSSSNTL